MYSLHKAVYIVAVELSSCFLCARDIVENFFEIFQRLWYRPRARVRTEIFLENLKAVSRMRGYGGGSWKRPRQKRMLRKF